VIRTGVAITLGLLLALAATLAPSSPATDAPGASLTVRLPSMVQAIVVGLLAASTVLLLLLQRPRRPAEDAPMLVKAPERRPAWAAVVALLPFVVLVGIACYIAWNRLPGEVHPVETAFTAIAGLLDFLTLARKPPMSMPFFDATIATLLLVFAVGLFGLLVIVALAERLEKWLAARRGGDAGPAAPRRAAAALADPRAEADPRLAILKAWARFEHALAQARAPRAPWQTPAELMRATVARLPVPAPAVRRLTALFEVARFSQRPLDAQARVAACDSVDEITAALDKDGPRAG
jgi:hypothetical protein